VHITKDMLGIQTRKSILYLDQSFWSMAFRKDPPESGKAMRQIEELLELQLLAVPYSSTHEAETQLWDERRHDLLRFIQVASRGHRFEPYYGVERTQILKAFQAYLANSPAAYAIDERDALLSCVHDWDDAFSVSVHRPVSAIEVQRRRGFKQRAVDELEKTLTDWKVSTNTFEQDMELELRDSARILIGNFGKKTSRLWAGDFSALLNSPIDTEIVEDMLYILRRKGSAELATIIDFFKSRYFTDVPSQQLSARLFSAFKKRVREGMYPDPRKARERLNGFLFDVQHAATYIPYCDAFFGDRFMADLLNDVNVAVEQAFGCKVFSSAKWPEFFGWLDSIEAGMTPDHADGLGWAYPKYRPKATVAPKSANAP
jgi:hypothetical protein